ncbi:MAG: tetratricopeptide repeat protein, partial [Candidatus Aminicenantes bacterium]
MRPGNREKQVKLNVILVFILVLLLGTMLFSSLPGNTIKKRTVTITLAVDENCFTKKQDPRDFFKTLINDISADFEKDFSLQFVVEKPVQWKYDGDKPSLSIDSLFSYFVKTVPRGHTDVVIGLTCQKGLKGEDGISFYHEGYVLVRWFDDLSFLKKVLKHEICHLFGATHVNDSDSLMDRFLRGDNINKINREIILLHRDRDFKGSRFPLAAHKMNRAAALYKEIAQINEKLIPNNLPPMKKRRLSIWLQAERVSGKQLVEVQKEYERLEDVYHCLALLYIELKEYPQAISLCRKALRINPQLYEAYNLMGIAFRRSGQIENAISSYHDALKINPSYQRIYYNLGIAYMKKGDKEQAISAYQKAIAGNPHLADAWNNLGYIYFEKGDIDRAVFHFKTAIACNPYHPLAHSNLAEFLMQKGETDLAMQTVKKALALNDQLPGPHNILGNILTRQGQLQEAEKEYKTAISLDSTYYKGYYNLGNLYKKQKKFSR